jgi:hypothetical protein
MKVVFHEDFYQVYSTDPASAPGRMEAVVEELGGDVEFVTAVPATDNDIALAHDAGHIESVRREGLYPISALAAGGAIQAATFGLKEFLGSQLIHRYRGFLIVGLELTKI